MRLASILVATTALFSAGTHAEDMSLPWSGRGQNLTVDTLTDEFLTHILTMRNGTTTGDPADYVTITQDGRSPAYNDDTGVISIGVDDRAIFEEQTNFRRSELVQDIAGNVDGETFFRASFKKDDEWLNAYSWQCIFPESHLFEIRIDASVDPPMIIFYTGGSEDTKWSKEFVLGTWYNFGIAVSATEISLYESEGDDPLALAVTGTNTEAPTDYEFHFGLLTLSDDGSAPVMVVGEQDILDYNGVSVEAGIPSDVSSSTAASTTSSAAETPSTTTSTAVSTVSSTSTAASEAEEDASTTTEAASASEAEDATTTDESTEDETTETPTVTTAAPSATSSTPASCKRRK